MTLCKMGNFRTKSEWLHLIDWLCTGVAFQLKQVYETGDGPTLFEINQARLDDLQFMFSSEMIFSI